MLLENKKVKILDKAVINLILSDRESISLLLKSSIWQNFNILYV